MASTLDYNARGSDDDELYECMFHAWPQSRISAIGDGHESFIFLTVKYVSVDSSRTMVSLFTLTRTLGIRQFCANAVAVLSDMFSAMPWRLPEGLIEANAPGIRSLLRQLARGRGRGRGEGDRALNAAFYVCGPYHPGRAEEEEVERAVAESAAVIRLVPATKEAIEALEEVKIETVGCVTRARARARKGCDVQCVVCFDELLLPSSNKRRVDCEDDGYKILRMPCSHVFHKGCIVPWLETSHFCPLCRHAMPTSSS